MGEGTPSPPVTPNLTRLSMMIGGDTALVCVGRASADGVCSERTDSQAGRHLSQGNTRFISDEGSA